jgi:hypothetical protein
LGPLGRLMIKAVETALNVVLLDKAGGGVGRVEVEGCLARLVVGHRAPPHRPKRLDFGIAILASLKARSVGRGGRGDRGGPGGRGGRGAIASAAGDNDHRRRHRQGDDPIGAAGIYERKQGLVPHGRNITSWGRIMLPLRIFS